MKPIHIACVGGWHSHARDFPMDRAKNFAVIFPIPLTRSGMMILPGA